jgi:hypothetical protein
MIGIINKKGSVPGPLLGHDLARLAWSGADGAHSQRKARRSAVRARSMQSPRSGWPRRRSHRRLTGGRDTERFFRWGRVGCREHARHDEIDDARHTRPVM